jgi:hypothetical protein
MRYYSRKAKCESQCRSKMPNGSGDMSDSIEARKEGALPWGAYSKIARRLRPKVTPGFVRRVALGEMQSERVSRAIENYRRALVRDTESSAA